jgi:tetratricopeptide (TPR) repeat protein
VAYTSEIEKLEKRWAENPKGRNFAPLADAYRKAGELDRAIELCKAGLARHPDYVSAHIVYGRCLIDLKNDAGASEVFSKVLSLDQENVLALKILAEISARGGRYDETVQWLSRLLNADPMNGEAAEALGRAKGKAAQAASGRAPAPLAVAPAAPAAAAPAVRAVVPRAPAPASAAATAPRMPAAAAPRAAPAAPPAPLPRPAPPAPPARAGAGAESVVRLVPETAPPGSPHPPPHHPLGPLGLEVVSEEPPPSPELHVASAPQDIETFDGTLDFDALAHGAARADGLEVAEEVQLKPEELTVEGLAHTQYESGLYAPPPDAALPTDETFPSIDLPLIMPDDVAEPAAAAPPEPVAPLPTARSVEPEPSVLPAAVQLSDDDGAADTAALSRAEPVLTETMAELYLRQGHQEDALRVYRALLTQRPGDLRLQARVDALSPGGTPTHHATGESLPEFLKRILAGRLEAATPQPPPPPPPPAAPAPPAPPPPAAPPRATAVSPRPVIAEGAGDARGSPFNSALRIASLTHELGPPVDAPGEATRPAGDSLSLDQVFGEESPRSAGPSAEPAEPAAPGPTPAPGAQTGGFSFDQFFSPSAGSRGASPGAGGGGARGGGGGGGGPAAGPPPGRVSGSGPRPAVEDEGELDQFQAWLRGLKS